MNLSTSKRIANAKCAKGAHDFGLALKALLRVPRGSAYNADSLVGMQPDVRVQPFIGRACRNCGTSSN